MLVSLLESLFLLSVSSHVLVAHSLNYSDLEAMDVNCPARDSCEDYRHDKHYLERSCECDFTCNSFDDCCINAVRRPSNTGRATLPSSIKCVHVGEQQVSGVYMVTNCTASWNGSPVIRRKCAGPPDFSDPMAEAPVTNVAQSLTYKNLYCAECNNANMESLQTFQFKLSCEGLDDLTQAQIMADLHFNQQRRRWGVSRLNSTGERIFIDCQIIYDVPGYLNRSVRFCRSNLISTCASNWTRSVFRRHCGEYMAVVFYGEVAYRNPHCALCNHKTVAQVACRSDLHSRKRPMSFALLLDVNQSDGDQVGMTQVATPECLSGHKYDPFFKRCRQLVCALPNHVVVNDRCVRQGR